MALQRWLDLADKRVVGALRAFCSTRRTRKVLADVAFESLPADPWANLLGFAELVLDGLAAGRNSSINGNPPHDATNRVQTGGIICPKKDYLTSKCNRVDSNPKCDSVGFQRLARRDVLSCRQPISCAPHDFQSSERQTYNCRRCHLGWAAPDPAARNGSPFTELSGIKAIASAVPLNRVAWNPPALGLAWPTA